MLIFGGVPSLKINSSHLKHVGLEDESPFGFRHPGMCELFVLGGVYVGIVPVAVESEGFRAVTATGWRNIRKYC